VGRAARGRETARASGQPPPTRPSASPDSDVPSRRRGHRPRPSRRIVCATAPTSHGRTQDVQHRGVRRRPLGLQHACAAAGGPRAACRRGSRHADADRAFRLLSVGGRPRAGEARLAPVPSAHRRVCPTSSLGPRVGGMSGARSSSERGDADVLAAGSPARAGRSVRIRISCHYWERRVARNALAGTVVLLVRNSFELWERRRPGPTRAVKLGHVSRWDGPLATRGREMHVPGNGPPYL